jgi:hypothetical protein
MTTSQIAELNDLCRAASGTAGQWVQTAAITALPAADQTAIRRKVREFKTFTLENNSHGERDFGHFEHDGLKILWKIDYYDRSLEYESEDPADPEKTQRVLTIMLADEY